MLRRRHQIHHPHFIILLLILTLGTGFTLFFSFNKSYQIATVVFMSLAYVLWGLIHHYKHQDLGYEVALEYILFALFGATVLISIILKS